MDIEQIQQAARRRLEEEHNARVASVKDYAEAAKRVADLRTALKEAERAHLAAHRAAVRRGWTETDLKAFGIDALKRTGSDGDSRYLITASWLRSVWSA